jgi:hypothetical protein
MTMIFVAANRAGEVSKLPDETLGASFINRIKRSAKKDNPRFRPFKLENEREYFILLAGQSEIGELKTDQSLKSANDQDFRNREGYVEHSFFMNDDWLYNGVIIREISAHWIR